MPGEFDLINWIRAQTLSSDRVSLGPGDDLAVLKWPGEELLLVGADQVLDGVHFDSRIHSPRQIGAKAMNRNLSDCAAMACLPAAAVATVALPRGVSGDYAKELYLGLRDAGDRHQCPVVGGDTGSWEGKLVVTVTILGRSGGIDPITRRGARAGETVYVTGPLGGSLRGRHMTFEPRVFLGQQLGRSGCVSAMIDLSDGLSRDARHIAEQSGVGIVIDADLVPVHEDAIAERSDGRTALEHALHDGEDYELLFTAPSMSFGDWAHAVGTVIEGSGVYLDRDGRRTPLAPQGWEHSL